MLSVASGWMKRRICLRQIAVSRGILAVSILGGFAVLCLTYRLSRSRRLTRGLEKRRENLLVAVSQTIYFTDFHVFPRVPPRPLVGYPVPWQGMCSDILILGTFFLLLCQAAQLPPQYQIRNASFMQRVLCNLQLPLIDMSCKLELANSVRRLSSQTTQVVLTAWHRVNFFFNPSFVGVPSTTN